MHLVGTRVGVGLGPTSPPTTTAFTVPHPPSFLPAPREPILPPSDAITTNAWFDDVSMVYTPLRFAPFGDQYRYVSTSEGCRGLPPTMR